MKRMLVTQLLLVGLIGTATGAEQGGAAPAAATAVVGVPPAAGANSHYVGNRPPLLPNPLIKLPIGGITPRNVGQVLETGVARVAVAGAVADAERPGEAARQLRTMLEKAGPTEIAD